MARVTDVLAGARAQADGQRFENMLDIAHATYRSYGIADIYQLPVPTAPAKTPPFRILSHRQRFDYVGVFGPNAGPRGNPGAWFGLAIAMEAKASAKRKPSLPIIDDRKRGARGAGIKYHQLDSLVRTWLDFGSVAALVWRNGQDRLVLLPPDLLTSLEDFLADRRKSIPADRFTAFDVVPYEARGRGRDPVVEDWLYTLRCWLEQTGRPCPGQSRRKDFDMVNYRVNEVEKLITTFEVDGTERVVRPRIWDLAMINRLALSATDAEDFERRLMAMTTANEG